MTREELLQDLAYARNLAEEGRNAPLIGGAYFIMFGVLLAICYGLQWAVLVQALPFDGRGIGLVWMGFGAAAMIGSALISKRVRAMPGGAAIPNRVDRSIWHAVTIAILTVVAGTVLRAMLLSDFTAPDSIVAAGFGLYGVALYATATIGGHTWLRTFAILAWSVSGTLWFFLHEPWTYLFAAVASLVVLSVPGLIMVRREPTAAAT
ncbi:MAG TPA: hypothetical protein VEA80_19515 [Vitreimonas sp.]|uniref:hypothetical protein n=1 Tax=Vitreimonas sp. TaxID=3069702 RepID=UPI002D2852F3|nr:hypothetical protein [Vitreimonas sp.]HYD89679.1 hypothetical protein [Vitreimonas sp.]